MLITTHSGTAQNAQLGKKAVIVTLIMLGCLRQKSRERVFTFPKTAIWKIAFSKWAPDEYYYIAKDTFFS
jgi:hypothetical protein